MRGNMARMDMAKGKAIRKTSLYNINTICDTRTATARRQYLNSLRSPIRKLKKISKAKQVEAARKGYEEENAFRNKNFLRGRFKTRNYLKAYISPEYAKLTKVRIYKIKEADNVTG